MRRSMEEEVRRHVGLDDLLDNDLSSYELYQSLSEPLKKEIRNRDINCFSELQRYVNEHPEHPQMYV